MAGVSKLAEEVTDESLGSFIQVFEVGGELNGGVSAEMREWSDIDLKCGIGKEEEHLTRDEGGAAEERRKSLCRHACCWPFAQKREKRLGFLET